MSLNLEKEHLKLKLRQRRSVALASGRGHFYLDAVTRITKAMTQTNSYVVSVEGAALHVAETGSGAPLMLIHGSLDGMQSFRRQVPEFAKHYRVVRYARRHHSPSESSAGSHDYALEIHVGDLIALMDALEMESAHLVGSSYGAYVALGMTLKAPGRVRSLVLAEPPILPFLERTEVGSIELESFRKTVLDPAREAFQQGNLRAGVRSFVDGIRGSEGAFDALPELSQEDLLRFGPELEMELTTEGRLFMPEIAPEALEALTTPVLLVSGERSPQLFHLITQELSRCLKHAREVGIPGAGHAMHVMNPRAYTAAVLTFLSTMA